MRIHRVLLDAGDSQRADDMTLTTPARTAWDVAVWRPLPDSVPIIDSLLRHGLVTPELLAETAARLVERPGGRRAQHAFGLAESGAAAPAESVLRIRLVLAALPRRIARHPVTVAPGIVVHPTLAWPDRRVAVELDLASHERHLDRRRQEALTHSGWTVVCVTGHRVRYEFAAVVQEIRDALSTRRRTRAHPRPKEALAMT
jgi:hypothetical protein